MLSLLPAETTIYNYLEKLDVKQQQKIIFRSVYHSAQHVLVLRGD